MNFGGCSLPAATPRNAPMPIFWHSARSYTLTVSRDPFPSSVAARARSVGLSSFAGALIRSRANDVASANASPRRAPSAASHARRGGPAQDLGGRLGAGAEPGDDDPTTIGVRVRDLPRFSLKLLGVEHALELPLRSAIEAREPLRQLRLPDVEADDERVGGDVLEPLRADLDLHSVFSPLSASARRIMSRRPWVVSSSATRSSANHCASAASLPAWTSMES